MKILMVNKFYYIKGGSETYYFELKKLLESHGHTIIDFSMKDDKNLESPYSEFFVEQVDYNKKSNLYEKLKASFKIIYSFEARKKIKKLIEATKPDIVHLHLFQHQISPSILGVIYKKRIPIVYTAHDLKMICPNYKMLNHNGVCEKCKNHRFYNCVKYKCIKESASKSLICMIESYLHLLMKSYHLISKVITPSEFYHQKFIEFGVPTQQVTYIPNFLSVKGSNPDTSHIGDYFLYFGRLSEEKGLSTLIEAFKQLAYPLFIVGTGPLETEIKTCISENQYHHIKLLGFKSGEELNNLIKGARATILPSEWYENSPYSAIEALSMGKIIIGADIGGILELIENNKTGYSYPSGDDQALKSVILQIVSTENQVLIEMQKNAFQFYLNRFTEKNHLIQIEKAYKEVLGYDDD